MNACYARGQAGSVHCLRRGTAMPKKKDYSQQGGDPSGSRWTDAGRKSGGESGEKSGKGQGKSGNQEDSKVNGNPLYTETPANKTFGNDKDTGGRGKGSKTLTYLVPMISHEQQNMYACLNKP